MNWMIRWAGGFPIFVESASGAHFQDVDGHDYIDFCLGDTGAMAGHSPAPTVAAVERQLAARDHPDAADRGRDRRRRGAPPPVRPALLAVHDHRDRRQPLLAAPGPAHLGRSKVVVHDHNYHGSVDETFASLDTYGRVVPSKGNTGPAVHPAETTRVVPFNDIPALQLALADRDVAAVLIEPALTNVGIVLPDPGYHDAVRALTRETGTILIIDETHTICAGPGGATGAWGLDPDMLVIGKTIGGGIPVGTYGFTEEIGDRISSTIAVEDSDIGGVGGTLAGYALSMSAVRATLTEVMTDAAFDGMIRLGERWTAGVEEVIASRGVPWHVTRLGCRAEYHFMPEPPRNGAEQFAASDGELERFLHLYAMNRRILMTPFHNMALMCPATTEADVDRHTEVFAAAVDELFG